MVSILIQCFVSAILWIKLISCEISELKKNGFYEYFGAMWNIIDLLQFLLCGKYLICFSYMVVETDCDQISFEFITPIYFRNIGSVACFLLWIKVFYWMRLFSEPAYFLRLITETIRDLKVFSCLVIIIFLAFSNFFFILNKNGIKDINYLNHYIGNHYIDAIIGMYFISLGEFKYDDFKKGPNCIMAWVFFLLATFLLLIVFMNMLIAIMGNTFSRVTEAKYSSALYE